MTKDEARVRDMVSWGERAAGYLNNISEAAFFDNLMLQDACERCIEVVGEAAGSVSESFCLAHSDVPWRELKDMRNILIHQYGAVDLQIVYETIQNDLPPILIALKKAIGE
jgi:uncharacterized protein with HEPN domain